MKLLTKVLGAATLACGLIASAQAAQIACPANIADNVTGATDCEYSDSATQDNVNDPLVVNDELFFGFNDWDFLKKDEFGDGAQAGTYDFGALFGTMMLVFKDGNDTTLVGYLVSTVSGTWTTPFENPPFDVRNPKDTSHLSYYVRGERQEIPEPGALALLGLGLASLAVVRRRRQ